MIKKVRTGFSSMPSAECAPAFRGCGTTWKTAPTSRASRVIRPTKSWTRRPRTSAVAEILGENRYLLGTDRPTSFDAVVFGMTILVYQLREMHPRLTDYARSLPNLTQYIGNLLTEFFPDLDRDF